MTPDQELASSVQSISATNGREERLTYILQAVKRGRFVSLRDITQHFGVNMQTARRDVAYLAGEKLVIKVHGGAIPLEESDALSMQERLSVNEEEKRCIAKAASAYIEEGDVIFLDGGSTTSYLAPHLFDKHVIVVTNSISLVAQLKQGWPNVEVILTGGYYYPKSELLLGPQAIQSVKHTHVNKAFLSAAGVTTEGAFNSNILVVELEQTVIRQASQIYLLADSSKLGRTSLVHVCGFEEIDKLITANDVPKEISTIARQANCTIDICSIEEK